MGRALVWAALGTLFTFMMTTLGAGTVFCFRSGGQGRWQRPLLGFAAGVMTAASVWSLLLPSIDRAEALRLPGWIPAAAGLAVGAGFLALLEEWLRSRQRSGGTLMIAAITLHNIPEGMAVGVAFGSLAYGLEGATLGGAIMLAVGIGLQNFPEGSAVSLPLLREGYSPKKAFLLGQFSGIVEPVSGFLGAVLVLKARFLLPYLLAFAAGAMIYVVVEELIPESQTNQRKDLMALFTLIGFSLMMVMDVALG